MTVGAWPIARMLGLRSCRDGGGTWSASSDAMARSRTLAHVPLLGRAHAPAGPFINVLLRAGTALLCGHWIVNRSEQRFAGKSRAPRDVIIRCRSASLLPARWTHPQ